MYINQLAIGYIVYFDFKN